MATLKESKDETAFEDLADYILNFGIRSAEYPEYNMAQLGNRAVERWEGRERNKEIYHLGIPT